MSKRTDDITAVVAAPGRRKVLIAGIGLAALPMAAVMAGDAVAQQPPSAKPHKTNVKTLLIASHPYPERSVMNKGLQRAAESVDGVLVRNLETIYGYDTRAIDGQAEREITRQHDRIVFMFPTHWFNITPMMKAYLNEVWGSVGPGLWQGKEMLVVTTAGGGASTYGEAGRIGVDLADVFTPMRASALHTGMTYLPPLAFQAVTASELPEYQRRLIERLQV